MHQAWQGPTNFRLLHVACRMVLYAISPSCIPAFLQYTVSWWFAGDLCMSSSHRRVQHSMHAQRRVDQHGCHSMRSSENGADSARLFWLAPDQDRVEAMERVLAVELLHLLALQCGQVELKC